MTTQFKKFLIGLFSLVLGIATFVVLLYFTIPRNAGLEGIVIAMSDIGLSLGSIFIYYILLIRVFRQFVFEDFMGAANQNTQSSNILLENKFSVLTLLAILSVFVSGQYGVIFYGLVPVFGILSLFKDRKAGKLLILTIGAVFLIFTFYERQTGYQKCLQEKIAYESDPKNNAGSFTCVN
ncbi:hypothetical protein A3A05_01200 [Candidatus Nomurabacteria bacterium RIFCSPLOWO2_01_FULL_41_12]|uniref:Uncharacterized protein n=1 Tax=Candidatus Nomurabacteria bacterium RIFCSPLOWO2_01_FULL_41_12 TaxID=1801774 RepID=A0A1F6WXR1_9BACT|nr:MAG: hypothetical protein A2732_02590 [Candidatus Nomurabacteria bacterium RIFCSPHIGHO2_01_FULL_40_10]OGI86574.1 MAG: hypothetical protein A3A05_01200 [Candidatus Nomurabacteria bacterium RIFCSPLOWO2_01_FULL_41_12]